MVTALVGSPVPAEERSVRRRVTKDSSGEAGRPRKALNELKDAKQAEYKRVWRATVKAEDLAVKAASVSGEKYKRLSPQEVTDVARSKFKEGLRSEHKGALVEDQQVADEPRARKTKGSPRETKKEQKLKEKELPEEATPKKVPAARKSHKKNTEKNEPVSEDKKAPEPKEKKPREPKEKKTREPKEKKARESVERKARDSKEKKAQQPKEKKTKEPAEKKVRVAKEKKPYVPEAMRDIVVPEKRSHHKLRIFVGASLSKYKTSTTRKGVTIIRQTAFKRKNHAKRLVWAGQYGMTSGGLQKKHLCCNRQGKIVSKLLQQNGRKYHRENQLDLWSEALLEAREFFGIKGFAKMKKDGNEQERKTFEKATELFTQKKVKRIVDTFKNEEGVMDLVRANLEACGKPVPEFMRRPGAPAESSAAPGSVPGGLDFPESGSDDEPATPGGPGMTVA